MTLYPPDKVGFLGLVGQESFRPDGQMREIALNRLGAVITVDQVLQWAMDGRTFHAQQGNAITLVDFVGTTYDEDQPQFALLVPAGKTVVPLSVKLNFQDQAGTDVHVVLGSAQNNIGIGTDSTALTATPMRTDKPHESTCDPRSLYTNNATAAVGLIEIDRIIDPFVATAAGRLPGYRWDIKQSSVVPVLVGPATLILWTYSTSDGVEGFGEYVWAEFETPFLVQKA